MNVVVVHLEAYVLSHRTEWCDACSLPSVVVLDIALTNAKTLRVMNRYEVSECTECGPA